VNRWGRAERQSSVAALNDEGEGDASQIAKAESDESGVEAGWTTLPRKAGLKVLGPLTIFERFLMIDSSPSPSDPI
jgi:hypothetical protein